MFKKTVHYKDFEGNQRSKTLYFHLSTHDVERLILENSLVERSESGDMKDATVKERFSDRIQKIVREGTLIEIMEFFDDLIQRSYGIIEDDGETFVKGPEVYKRWSMSSSYLAFMDLLKSDQSIMTDFVNQIMPEEIQNAMKEDPEFKSHREALEKQSYVK